MAPELQKSLFFLSLFYRTQRFERRPLGLADAGDASDLHTGVGARGTQDPLTLATFDIPQPDRLFEAAAGHDPAIWAKSDR